jgi:hypothetical protein
MVGARLECALGETNSDQALFGSDFRKDARLDGGSMAALRLLVLLLDGRCSDGSCSDSLEGRLEILGRPPGGVRPSTSRLRDSDERLGYRFSRNDSDTTRILIFD